jgi:hypothetical protein
VRDIRKIAIGESDFKYLIKNNCFYIDKTLFIKELLDDPSRVLLITRPRRFGKTLNLSMVKYYFSNEENHDLILSLFKRLKIGAQDASYLRHIGNYPVISLTFKDIRYTDWNATEKALEQLIQNLFIQHKYVLTSLEKEDRHYYEKILSRTAGIEEYRHSLQKLIEFIYKHKNIPVWVLIDEYDVPIQQGYLSGYYTQIIEFFTIFFSASLKDNPLIAKAILTGVLRIAKESIFSGLNNLKVASITNSQYSLYFGLLESEMPEILKEYQLEDQAEQVQSWYDGYEFGNVIVYNPWSITCYLDQKNFLPYWDNTSGNGLIRDILTKSGPQIKRKVEDLLNGKGILHKVDENVVFGDLITQGKYIWDLFLASGYLRANKRTDLEYTLTIPNQEVKLIYEDIIKDWFESSNVQNLDHILTQLIKGQFKAFSQDFQSLILECFSIFDVGSNTAENFYHAFVLGMLVNLKHQYEITSNRESGMGRYDLCLNPKYTNDPGILIEFKVLDQKKDGNLVDTAQRALNQIETLNYIATLKSKKISPIFLIGIAFEGKKIEIAYKTF